MNTTEFGRVIESICPVNLSESWDNCGFQICFGEKTVKKVLVALEVTEEVIDEAVKHDASLIVTHHPMIFGGINKINDNDIIGNHIIRLVSSGISVISCHTNFDKMDNGNNDYFGKVICCSDIRKIVTDDSMYLRKGLLPREMQADELKNHIGKCLNINPEHIRVAGNTKKLIRKCAWCTGAGSEFKDIAFDDGCDCYITGDLKYHEVQEAEFLGRTLIDAGHYGSEKIFTPNMASHLRKCNLHNIEIIESQIDINPFKIFEEI